VAEEILRLKTIVIPDNAGMRQVTANLQNIGQQGQRTFVQLKTGADSTTQSLRAMHREAQQAGQMIGRVFGAFGASVTAGAIAQRIHTLSKEVIDLSYSTRELGLSERQVRAFMNTAERAGVAGEAMKQGLGSARQALEGLNFASSTLRDTMIQLGGRETARRLAAIPDQGKRTVEFFKYLNQLMESGPAGRRGAEAIAQSIGLPLQTLRVQIQDVESEFSRLKDRTDEEKKAAQQLNESVLAIGKSFDQMLIRATPAITGIIDGTNRMIDRFSAAKKAHDDFMAGISKQFNVPQYEGLGRGFRKPGEEPSKGQQGPLTRFWNYMRRSSMEGGGGALTGGMGIVQAMMGGNGTIAGGGGTSDLRGAAGEDRLQDEETTEEGTFKALVRFDSYLKMGRNLGAMGGGGVGGGGGGGAGGGGGGGGQGGGGGGQGGGSGKSQSDGQTTAQTPGGATVPQPGQGTAGPLGLPMVPGAPGATAPGQGTAGPLGLPMVPGAPGVSTPGAAPAGAQLPTGKGGSGVLAAERAGLKAELDKNPELKERAMAMMHTENDAHPSRPFESAANRAGLLKKDLAGILTPKFYGPMRTAKFQQALAAIRANPKLREKYQAALDKVFAGSNELKGATDQGTKGDPNWANPSGRVVFPDQPLEAYNDLKVAGAAQHREEQQRRVAEADKAQTGSPQKAEEGPSKSDAQKAPAGAQAPGGVGPPYKGVTSMKDLTIRPGSGSYGASRSGGGRAHSGNDLHAPGGDGSEVLSMTGGTVLYNGNNSGYGANIVIKGDDGVIRRYATHASTANLRPGARVAQGQTIGTQGAGHTHYEEIPPTIGGKPNPVYHEFEKNAQTNTFTQTSNQRGTVDPSGPQGTLAQIGKTPPTSVAAATPSAPIQAPPGGWPNVPEQGFGEATPTPMGERGMTFGMKAPDVPPGGGMSRITDPAYLAQMKAQQNRFVTPETVQQVAMEDAKKQEGVTGAVIDRANGAQTSTPQSSVNLEVKHNGTKAEAKAQTKGPQFAQSKISNHTQMQKTDEFGSTANP
jgi:hypothetical protein